MKMNHMISIAIFCSIVLLVPNVYSFQVSFFPDTLRVDSHEFNVNLKISQNNHGFRGFKIYLKYDHSMVEFVQAQKGGLVSGFNNYWWTVVRESENVVRVECIVLGAGLSIDNSGIILNLAFRELQDGIQNVSIEKHEFYNAQNGAIIPNVSSETGTIIVNRALLPIVTDPTVRNIEPQSAVLGGNVVDSGDSPIIERGVIWGRDKNFTMANCSGKATKKGSTGSFTVTATALLPGTKYYFRAFATSLRETAYSEVSHFETPSRVLPVEFGTFSATAHNRTVVLNWKTLSESRNYGFEIQRLNPQATPERWEKIGFVPGHGNSNVAHHYEWCDESSLNRTARYRLRQIDTDGSFSFSKVIEIQHVVGAPRLRQNYPNPFNASTTIEYALPADGFVKLSLYNICGRLIETLFSGQQTAGTHRFQLEASHLPSGMYWYRLETGTFSEIRRFSLVK